MAIVLKDLQNVSSPLHLSVTSGNVQVLLFPHFPASIPQLSIYAFSIVLPPSFSSLSPQGALYLSLQFMYIIHPLILPKT
jgi:hypothetical protein